MLPVVGLYPELVLADEPVAPEEEVAPERRPGWQFNSIFWPEKRPQ